MNWIVFKRLTGLTIQGHGTIEGRGSGWWHISALYDPGDTSDDDDEADLMDLPQDDNYDDQDDDDEVQFPDMLRTLPGFVISLNEHICFSSLLHRKNL